MKERSLKIDQQIFLKYPDVAVGYLVVDQLNKANVSSILTNISNLPISAIVENHLTLQNLVDNPTIANWRKIYSDCSLKPKTYKSSIESLLRRFMQNDYKNIMPVVDAYNYISAGNILSAGGYNYDAINGDLSLRYGSTSDVFTPLNGKVDIAVSKSHIVYADEHPESIVCWMWNHKDSKRTMLQPGIEKGLFLFDSITTSEKQRLNNSIITLSSALTSVGSVVLKAGIVDRLSPQVRI